MRVGIDVRLWNETGVGRYIRNLTLKLQNIDTRNEYFILARKDDIANIKSQISNNRWEIIAADIQWHSLREQYELPKILNKLNLDIVHFPYFSVPIFYRKPFIVTIHDLIMKNFATGKASILPKGLYKIKRAGYHLVVNNAVKSSRKIIVPLNTVKKDLIRSFNIPEDKIVVTNEGVDDKVLYEPKKNQSKNEHGKYFLYIGNAYPHKNLERLIGAFAIFKKKETSDVKLLLVGKDDFFYKRLKKKIDDPSIIFLHNISDEKLAVLYHNAISFISASLMEGFGLPVIEAMSNKCLVLLSDIPSFREVCQDAAVYFNPYDTSDIADKFRLAFGSFDKTKFIQKGKIRAKDFSWEKMARETLQVYEASRA